MAVDLHSNTGYGSHKVYTLRSVRNSSFPLQLVRFLFVFLSLSVLYSCHLGTDDLTLETPVVSGDVDARPFLSSLSGAGTINRGVSPEALSAGMQFEDGDVVQLDESAVAYIQFEDAAIARVEGAADFEIRLHSRGTESVMTIMLGSGTTIVRRRPEASGNTIRVRTNAGIIEPDGTSFRVARTPESTSVQVASGRVRVLSTSVDPDELRALTDIEEVLSVLDEISDTSVFVDADGMVLLRPEDVSTASEILADMKEQLSEFGVASTPDDATVRSIQTVLRYAADRMAQARPDVSSITVAERTEILDRTSDRFLPLQRETDAEDNDGPARLTIQTDPPGAEILLDGIPVGNQIFSGLFESGETVTIEVRSSGYISRVLEVEFRPDLDERLLVTLERRQPNISRGEFFRRLRQGDVETVQQWVQDGGDPDIRTNGGLSALAVAFGAELSLQDLLGSFRPSADIVTELLDAGANPDPRFDVDASTFTPLTAVLLSGLFRDDLRLDLVETLLEAGASPDIVLETGEMRVTALALPIIIGIERGDVDVTLVNRFLEAGADVNATVVYEGRILNPLAMALVLGAEYDYDPAVVVERLINAGARANDRIRVQGTIWTPIDFAEEAGLTDSARVLREVQP